MTVAESGKGRPSRASDAPVTLRAGGGDLLNGTAAETVQDVGRRIRKLRSGQGMRLQDLAASTGVSVSMLSMLERGMAAPSIGTLVAVASALGVHMSDLFQPLDDAVSSPVRRHQDQVEVQAAEGVRRRVVQDDRLSGLEMVVNEYAPGTSSSPQPVHHVGQEFGLVLTGVLTVELDGTEYVLRAGDGITYASTTNHRISNCGRSTARAVWVNLRG